MGTLRFDGKGVARCLDHASTSKEHRDGHSEPNHACLFLVKDHGIYIMSNGLPPDKRGGKKDNPRCFVVYADGCDPSKNEDWWDLCYSLVGGDDFAEDIPVSSFKPEWIKKMRHGQHDLMVETHAAQFTMYPVHRASKASD